MAQASGLGFRARFTAKRNGRRGRKRMKDDIKFKEATGYSKDDWETWERVPGFASMYEIGLMLS